MLPRNINCGIAPRNLEAERPQSALSLFLPLRFMPLTAEITLGPVIGSVNGFVSPK
jgi:hypothetical protein